MTAEYDVYFFGMCEATYDPDVVDQVDWQVMKPAGLITLTTYVLHWKKKAELKQTTETLRHQFDIEHEITPPNIETLQVEQHGVTQ